MDQPNETESFTHLDDDYLAYLFLGASQEQPQLSQGQPPRTPNNNNVGATAAEPLDFLAELERHFDLDLDSVDLSVLGIEEEEEEGEGGTRPSSRRKQRRFDMWSPTTAGATADPPLLPLSPDGVGQESPIGGESPILRANSVIHPFLPPHLFALPISSSSSVASSSSTTSSSSSSSEAPASTAEPPSGPIKLEAAASLTVVQGRVSYGAGVQRNILRLNDRRGDEDRVIMHLPASAPHAVVVPKAVSDSRKDVGKIHDMMARRKVKGVRRTRTTAAAPTAAKPSAKLNSYATQHITSALSAMSVSSNLPRASAQHLQQRAFPFRPAQPPSVAAPKAGGFPWLAASSQ